MVCVASRDYNPFISINTTNYRSNQIQSSNWFTPTYNTTNTPNELSSHQFTCTVPCKETTETSLFFGSSIVHTTAPCFVFKQSKYWINSNHNTFFHACSLHVLLWESTSKCVLSLIVAFFSTHLLSFWQWMRCIIHFHKHLKHYLH